MHLATEVVFMSRLIESARYFLAFVLVSSVALAADSNWPRWRGPRGDGHATGTETPTRWDPTSVLWKTPLPGNGQSSPTIWGDRIFLTSALENGKQRVVFCVDARDGKIVWQKVAWTGEPEKSHNMNGWASASCATDGEIVVAFFGKGGLHAYSLDGQPLWSKDLGPFECPWGTAACPIIVGNLVIQNGDSDKDAFLEAFDRKTGSSVWRRKRPDNRGWSTPILLQRGTNEELVLNGHTGVTAYNPATGEELWFSGNSNGRGEPTVTLGSGLLFVVCGLAGDMYALQPPGAGTKSPQKVWSAPRRGNRDLPSPIVVENYVIVSTLNGIVTCYDSGTGKVQWLERLNGQFSSSPIAVGGLVLHQNEDGETSVIEPGPTLKIVSVNKLGHAPDELFRSSLTPVGNRIYSRSNKFLYCIGSATSAGN
jgi:outer membrane protein assembly factor BamB